MPLPADGPVTAGDLLTLEALGHFRRTSTVHGIGLVLHAWGVIAGAIALYLRWPSVLTLGVATLVIAARQLGLMVLMHEAAHWLLFRQGRLNTWAGTWLCAAPLPVSRGRLALALAGDLGGWTALRRIAGWRPLRDGFAETWRRARAPLLANAALCAVLTALGGWPLYLLTWVLPWATWFQLVTRVRDIAEHGLVHDAEDPLRNTRTIGAGLLARAFVAPYGVNYHLEHHLLVFVPCWKLREVQALLLAKGLGGRMERAASYGEVLGRATCGIIGAGARPRAGTDIP
ncbi:MAG TPA: fatty acid desaturase family protein [Methylomirabilota bacterium]|nr:fatty acid desaturase family protein [Methylomirabilota bacterium]